MDVTEIKELYAEELALLKTIQAYLKEHPRGNPERVEIVKLLLLYRIFSNLHSAFLLTMVALKKGKISFWFIRYMKAETTVARYFVISSHNSFYSIGR